MKDTLYRLERMFNEIQESSKLAVSKFTPGSKTAGKAICKNEITNKRVNIIYKCFMIQNSAALFIRQRARNSWYFGSKCYHAFSFATRILMW